MNHQLTLLFAAGGSTLLMLRSGLFAVDAATAALGFALLALCLGPSLVWVWGGMRHLPIFEVYALMHLIYYWHPAGKVNGTVLNLEPEQRLVFLGAASLFLMAGAVAYYGLFRKNRAPGKGWRFWNKEVSVMRDGRLPWFLLAVWVTFLVGVHYGFIWNMVPNALFQPVRSMCWTAGMVAIFVLASEAGLGRLSTFRIGCFIVVLTTGVLVHFAGGFLASGTLFAGNAFFAYTVGGRKLPVLSLAIFVLMVSFLNYGKGEMRARYWLGGESSDDLVELYAHWFRSSWEEINAPEERRRGSISGFERANLTDVCARVTTQSPTPIPFLGGTTYTDSLQLFVPRLIWPDRPTLHVIMNELGLRYGIHTDAESAETTMISIGQIAEAWANGGWLGVALAGAFFGALFSIGARIAYQREHLSVGFLFGMVFVTLTANLEHLAGTLLMTFYQTAAGSLALLYWFSQRSSPTRKLPAASEGQAVASVG